MNHEQFVRSLTAPAEGCDICYDPFDNNEHSAVRLACGHWFGTKCILSSIEQAPSPNTCPNCRDQMYGVAPPIISLHEKWHGMFDAFFNDASRNQNRYIITWELYDILRHHRPHVDSHIHVGVPYRIHYVSGILLHLAFRLEQIHSQVCGPDTIEYIKFVAQNPNTHESVDGEEFLRYLSHTMMDNFLDDIHIDGLGSIAQISGEMSSSAQRPRIGGETWSDVISKRIWIYSLMMSDCRPVGNLRTLEEHIAMNFMLIAEAADLSVGRGLASVVCQAPRWAVIDARLGTNTQVYFMEYFKARVEDLQVKEPGLVIGEGAFANGLHETDVMLNLLAVWRTSQSLP
ncbi:hypothetical protein P280DRAFT_517168 [Massarina eburnea CBS 473.64]|uniref:RING-type domain-containing protein n=1 Tax=Massarina eburnea CBS 473.64 TaxID=1395130 RepID=A0A6A6S7M7_9PLEO|nr:hypothetical protein P280DRAFT_517168 [Massarina eburnea CBS 473.64]